MRIDRQVVDVARRFDATLAQRLTDGTVSDVDLQTAQRLYQNVLDRPMPPPTYNQWGMPQQNTYVMQKFQRDLNEAQFLYSRISDAYQSQNPAVTQMETQKDLMNMNGGNAGWGNRYPQQQDPMYQPSIYPQYPQQQYPIDQGQHRRHHHRGNNDGTAAVIGILVGLGAFEAVRNMR